MTIDKAALRKAMHERREALPSPARAHAAGAIAAHAEALLALLPSNPAPVVSSYWAIGPELDAVSLEAAVVARGGSLCLPVMVGKGKPLLFRAYCHGDTLSPRTWGIQEPLATADEALPDLLLVPSLALDRRGHRLGYGGGFYDRTLAMLRARRPTVAVGLCYDEQVVEAVPYMHYDASVDWILTPSGLFDCRSAS
jgi:5-formyltetrahydrofolate cyclo-ligase